MAGALVVRIERQRDHFAYEDDRREEVAARVQTKPRVGEKPGCHTKSMRSLHGGICSTHEATGGCPASQGSERSTTGEGRRSVASRSGDRERESPHHKV